MANKITDRKDIKKDRDELSYWVKNHKFKEFNSIEASDYYAAKSDEANQSLEEAILSARFFLSLNNTDGTLSVESPISLRVLLKTYMQDKEVRKKINEIIGETPCVNN